MAVRVSSIVLVSIICITFWNQVHSFPTGAPAGACTNLTADVESHDSPQTSPVPYMLDLSNLDNGDGFSYVPGETYSSRFIVICSLGQK